MTLPVSASIILKQSLPWLYPKFREKHGRAWGSILLRRGTRWYAGLQKGKTDIGGRPPKNTSCGESMPLFAVVVEWLSPSHAHKTDPIYKLEPSGSRTPLSLSRCTSGKSLLTSSRVVCPALIAFTSPLSTVPFCCGVYGAVSSRRIPRRYNNQRTSSWCTRRRCRSQMLAELPCRPQNVSSHRKWQMRSCPRTLYGRWKREALSTNTMTYREPPSHSWNGPAVSMGTMSMGAAARDVVRCGVGARIPFAIGHSEYGASSSTG